MLTVSPSIAPEIYRIAPGFRALSICVKAAPVLHPDAGEIALREACEAVHKHIRQAVEQGTETMTIPVGADLLAKVEEVLKGYGWTVEESAVLFFMWCVACPEQVKVWLAKCRNGEIQ